MRDIITLEEAIAIIDDSSNNLTVFVEEGSNVARLMSLTELQDGTKYMQLDDGKPVVPVKELHRFYTFELAELAVIHKDQARMPLYGLHENISKLLGLQGFKTKAELIKDYEETLNSNGAGHPMAHLLDFVRDKMTQDLKDMEASPVPFYQLDAETMSVVSFDNAQQVAEKFNKLMTEVTEEFQEHKSYENDTVLSEDIPTMTAKEAATLIESGATLFAISRDAPKLGYKLTGATRLPDGDIEFNVILHRTAEAETISEHKLKDFHVNETYDYLEAQGLTEKDIFKFANNDIHPVKTAIPKLEAVRTKAAEHGELAVKVLDEVLVKLISSEGLYVHLGSIPKVTVFNTLGDALAFIDGKTGQEVEVEVKISDKAN